VARDSAASRRLAQVKRHAARRRNALRPARGTKEGRAQRSAAQGQVAVAGCAAAPAGLPGPRPGPTYVRCADHYLPARQMARCFEMSALSPNPDTALTAEQCTNLG